MHNKYENLLDFDLYSYFYGLVRQIPRGMVTSYGDLASALGDLSASRACGHMLSINPDPIGTPCYRVVHSNGDVGKYTHPLGQDEKIRKLQADGIEIVNGVIKNFDVRRFTSFTTDYPLEIMKSEQDELASMVRLEDDFDNDRIGAIDVSYDDHNGYGAFVFEDDGEISVRTVVMPVRFPYIPGYLAYREYRFIKALCQGFKGTLLVDGNGFLHPRRIGLASYAGVKLDIPTVGVAKSLLMGRLENNWVISNGERIGYMINRKTFVSSGHRISLNSAVSLVQSLNEGHYPELLKIAHNETVRVRNKIHMEVTAAIG